MSTMNRIIQITRRANREEGLSLIELMVAISILFIALLALARTATVAFTDVAVARQRQTGSQLANRLLEEVRGLPYETVLNGLADEDLAGDPDYIVNCGGTDWYYLACPAEDPNAEEIVHTPRSAALLADPDQWIVPLVPHQGEVGPPDFPSTFEWGVYVTEAEDAPEAGALRVTVRVTWTANQRAGLRNFAEARTLVYSPEGCVDSATHPFSAPCQPYFYGNGFLGSGGVRTTGTLDGVSFDAVDVDLSTQSSDAQMEQITHVEGSLNLPRAAVVVDGVETATDPTSVSSAADDDPSTSASEYNSATVGPQAPGSLSLSGGSRGLSISIGGGMAGDSSSTTAANTTNTCNSQLDDLPCGYGSSLQAGAISETVDLGTDTGTSALVSVGAAGTQGTTYVRRLQPGGSLGLVQETVQWVLPEIQLGGLPSGMETSPPGWEGYWVALTGFSATATAEAGEGTVAPSVTITGGTIRYWNGSGYTDQAVTAGGGAVPIAPVDFTQTSGGPNIQVQITGTVTVQQTGITEELDGTDRIQSKASVGTPLVAEMVYRVFENDSNVTRLLVQFDAGGARAATIYQAAPTEG
jgi:type II secretory pathway pseudopilin PulG